MQVILCIVQISLDFINSTIIIPNIEGDFHWSLASSVAINTGCFCRMRINKSMYRLYLFISLQLAANIGKVQSNIAAGAITSQVNAACDIKVAIYQNIAAAADSQVALSNNLALFVVAVQQVGATAHVRAILQGIFHGADGDIASFGSLSFQLISMGKSLRNHCLIFVRHIILVQSQGITVAIVNTGNNNVGAFFLIAQGNQLTINS